MNSIISKRTSVRLIIASQIWLLAGCYTAREILQHDEGVAIAIPVTKTNGESLTFALRKIDSLGNLLGQIVKRVPSETSFNFDELREDATIARDSIRSAYLGTASVVTTSGLLFQTDDLSLDSAGTCSLLRRGMAKWITSTDFQSPIVQAERLSIDTVKSISLTRLNAGKTAWLVSGIVVGTAIVAGITYAIIALSRGVGFSFPVGISMPM